MPLQGPARCRWRRRWTSCAPAALVGGRRSTHSLQASSLQTRRLSRRPEVGNGQTAAECLSDHLNHHQHHHHHWSKLNWLCFSAVTTFSANAQLQPEAPTDKIVILAAFRRAPSSCVLSNLLLTHREQEVVQQQIVGWLGESHEFRTRRRRRP